MNAITKMAEDKFIPEPSLPQSPFTHTPRGSFTNKKKEQTNSRRIDIYLEGQTRLGQFPKRYGLSCVQRSTHFLGSFLLKRLARQAIISLCLY